MDTIKKMKSFNALDMLVNEALKNEEPNVEAKKRPFKTNTTGRWTKEEHILFIKGMALFR